MPTNVGSIDATLTLDRSPFMRELRAAKAEAEQFEHHRYTANLNVDSDPVRRGLQGVEQDARKAQTSLGGASRGMGLLVTAALGLGPALIPLGAVAAGAIAGLAPAAGTAVLAFLGLRDAWKQGTLQATPLGKQIGVFRDEFDKLKQISAGGVMPGFTKALQDIRPLFGPINKDVALFSVQLGAIVSHAAPGLVQVFLQLQPLFQTFGDLLVKGATRFQQWATSGDGIKNFVAYVQTNLPVVLSTMGSLLTTVSHLAQGFAPFGSTSLMAIKLFSGAINAIPIGVLQVLVPLLTGAALGMKAISAATGAAASLEGLASKIGTAGVGARAASGFVGGLGKAVGFLGPVGLAAGIALGGLSAIMGSNAKAAQEQARRVNDLTTALRDGSSQQAIITQLQGQGATDAASKYGITLNTLLGVVHKNTDAQTTYQAQIRAAKEKVSELALAQTDASKAADPHAFIEAQKAYRQSVHELENLENGVNNTTKALGEARGKVAEYATAEGDASLSADILSGKTKAAAAALGLTEEAYIAGRLAADKNTAAQKAAHDAMVVAADGAGLLKEKLDALNGVSLGIEGSTIAYNQAVLTLTTNLAQNGKTIDLNTQAGISNRSNILNAIQTAESQAIAVTGATKATVANTTQYRTNIQALLERTAKANGDKTATDRQKDATYQLILTLSGYNKLPIPTKTPKVDIAPGKLSVSDLEHAYMSMPDKTVHVSVDWSSAGPGGAPGPAAVLGHGAATGGLITGPGGPKDDQIPILASNKEFMVQAAAVEKYGVDFFHQLNAMKLAAGGEITLNLPTPQSVAAGTSNAEDVFVNKWGAQISALILSKMAASIPGGGAAVGGNVGALQAYAFSLFPSHGWGAGAQSSLVALWNGESGWNPNAVNPSSGAWGIPQSLPGDKMASAGADWRTNGATQIRWGEQYIADVYGSPTNAYSAWLSRSPHWYGDGMPPTTFDRPTLIGVGESGPETVSVRRGAGDGLNAAVLAALQALLAELRAMRANTDPWKVAQVTKMYERTR